MRDKKRGSRQRVAVLFCVLKAPNSRKGRSFSPSLRRNVSAHCGGASPRSAARRLSHLRRGVSPVRPSCCPCWKLRSGRERPRKLLPVDPDRIGAEIPAETVRGERILSRNGRELSLFVPGGPVSSENPSRGGIFGGIYGKKHDFRPSGASRTRRRGKKLSCVKRHTFIKV